MTLLGSLTGYFWLILGSVYLILQIFSIFFYETLYMCSWCNPDGYYTQENVLHHAFPLLGVILEYFGTYFGICTHFSRYPFSILSWHFAQVFLVWPWLLLILFWHHVSIFRGWFKGVLGPILAYYVYFLRTVQYVLWYFVQTLLVFFLRVAALFFSYRDPPGEP